MSKTEIQHVDKLGRPLKVGDPVAYPESNMLTIGKVVKLNPKMVGVEAMGQPRWRTKANKYPTDVVILDCPEILVYALKINA